MSSQEDSLTSGISSKYSFRPIIYLVIKNWYLYVLSFVIFFAIAFLINKYTAPTFNVKCSILIKNSKGNSLPGGPNSLLEDKTLSFVKLSTNIADEKEILTSRSLISDVLDRLDFSLSIYEIGRIKTNELYKNSPIKIEYKLIDSLFYTKFIYINTLYFRNFLD